MVIAWYSIHRVLDKVTDILRENYHRRLALPLVMAHNITPFVHCLTGKRAESDVQCAFVPLSKEEVVR